jgi:predicted ATPase
LAPNGVGKSNFISFFKLLNSIYEQRLRNFVADNGYEDRMLYFGRKKSKFLAGGIIFKPDNGNVNNRYDFKIVPQAQSTGFYFETEKAGYNIYSSGVMSSGIIWI